MLPVCAIFDIGKTNKKCFLFDNNFQIVYEQQIQFDEIYDDDGFHAEDLDKLSNWIKETFEQLLNDERFEIKALNFSAYGASLVHLDFLGKTIAPLYNYLKPYPETLLAQFYKQHGNPKDLTLQTASPNLGMLNAGLQLYWLKHSKPAIYNKIEHSLHLPQYCSFLFTQKPVSEITSLGCHTFLWDFRQEKYHQWIAKEQIHSLGQMLMPSFVSFKIPNMQSLSQIQVGVGMHDSSAALVPYLMAFTEPFLLISTGTWSISMNPFSTDAITASDLRKDCLNYLTFRGNIVKASRLFSGNQHDRQTKHLAEYFGKEPSFYKMIPYLPSMIDKIRGKFDQTLPNETNLSILEDSTFSDRNLNEFGSYEEAYHQLMLDLMARQVAAIQLVMGKTPIKQIFVDGGFSKNELFMNLLAEAFPKKQIFASEISQATALGAALVVGQHWTSQTFGIEHFKLKKY